MNCMDQTLRNMDMKDYEIYDWFCHQCDVDVKEEDRERAQRLVLSSLVKKITDIAMEDGVDSLDAIKGNRKWNQVIRIPYIWH